MVGSDRECRRLACGSACGGGMIQHMEHAAANETLAGRRVLHLETAANGFQEIKSSGLSHDANFFFLLLTKFMTNDLLLCIFLVIVITKLCSFNQNYIHSTKIMLIHQNYTKSTKIMLIWSKLCSFVQNMLISSNYAHSTKIMLIWSKLCSIGQNYAHLIKIMLSS